ncbi:hypothetical protein CSOJ01_14315 [Colletotrichum sojae]|uniref:Uncharacterized protein n=1 Tax=Colletotrichum sojae TaxID=2175907 RepID=A0A8H6IR53_9PEZI|nr:hypothetical protein CSOJ01_14315 [Colletotrichum sojae]
MTVELMEKDSGSSPSQPQSVDPDDSVCPLMDTSSPKSSPSKHTRNKINNDPIHFHEEYMQYLIVTLPLPRSGTENVQAWMQHILTSRRFNNLGASNIYWTGWDLHTLLLGDMMDELHDLGLTRRQSELVTLDITTAVLLSIELNSAGTFGEFRTATRALPPYDPPHGSLMV